MNKLKQKMVASGLGLGLLAGGAAGAVLGTAGTSGAQETTTTQAPVEQPADAQTSDGQAPAEGERPSDEEMAAKHKERLAETLAPLVQAGTITQAQADAVIDALAAAQAERGPGGPGGKGGRGEQGGRGGPGLDAAAAALGVTVDELREALSSGSTLAQIAEQKGVERQALIDALTTSAKERIMTKLSEGTITQEQADEKLADLDSRIAEQVDRAGNERGPGRGSAPRNGTDGQDDAPAQNGEAGQGD